MNIGYIYAFGAAIAWGLLYAIDQKILQSATPAGLTFATSVAGVVVTLPIILSKGTIRQALGGDAGNIWLIVLSAALMTASSILVLAGIKELNATFVSIIETAYPLFVVLFSFVLFRTVPNIWFFAGGALIMAGTIIVMTKATTH